MDQLIPTKQIKLGKQLGEGGFGIVYEGEWNTTKVAIKTLRLQNNQYPEAWKAFRKEVNIMVKLNHPNIVQLYGICKSNIKYWMVLEFIPKGDLLNLLTDKKEQLPWTRRLSIAMNITSGLSYLHDKNIMHRDLKSPNVLIDTNYCAKLADFGFSRIKIATKTAYTSSSEGTVSHMAPELFERKVKLTPMSDIYALGVVFWEIVARQEAWKGVKTAKLVEGVEKNVRPSIPNDCPKALEMIIKKCWVHKYESRPTASKVLELLKSVPVKIVGKKVLQQEYESGLKLYRQKDYARAITHFQKAKEHVVALYMLARCYEYGRGVKKNINQAIQYYIQSADKGNSDAQLVVGLRYYIGSKVKKNYTLAVKYFKRAAVQGNTTALFRFGLCHYHGHGVRQSYNVAVGYLRPAANKGHPEAAYYLGRCYEEGNGVKKDIVLAARFYRKSAEKLLRQ